MRTSPQHWHTLLWSPVTREAVKPCDTGSGPGQVSRWQYFPTHGAVRLSLGIPADARSQCSASRDRHRALEGLRTAGAPPAARPRAALDRRAARARIAARSLLARRYGGADASCPRGQIDTRRARTLPHALYEVTREYAWRRLATCRNRLLCYGQNWVSWF